MRTSTFLLGASIQALNVFALPLNTAEVSSTSTTQFPEDKGDAYNWASGYSSEFTIHPSCNSTERRELTEGLRQAVELAEHAKNHILVHGNKSEVFQKYFGAGGTGTPIGYFDKIASGNRAGIVFRCDDPDNNCATQDNWAGHWRGSNATTETVICPRSYLTRLPLVAMCARGLNIATGRVADYWGADLMHRLYHVPLVGEGLVEHYGDGYEGVQELAAGENYTLAGMNSATLTYFASEAYAYDIAIPGEGCVGKAAVANSADADAHAGAVSSTTTSASASATVVSTPVTSVNPTRIIPAETTAAATAEAAESTSDSAGKECHFHDDGTEHCV